MHQHKLALPFLHAILPYQFLPLNGRWLICYYISLQLHWYKFIPVSFPWMHQETYEQQPRYVRVQGTFLLLSLNNQNRCFNSSSLHNLLVLYWCIYATMVIYIHNHRARTAHNIPIAVQDEWKWVARIRWCVKAETFHEKWQDWRWKDLRAHTHGRECSSSITCRSFRRSYGDLEELFGHELD